MGAPINRFRSVRTRRTPEVESGTSFLDGTTEYIKTIYMVNVIAPRTADALRRMARAARHVVTPHHCQQWFAHARYAYSSTIRG